MATTETNRQNSANTGQSGMHSKIGIIYMKPLLPHISIGSDETGRVILEIEDYELFNFIDDYLTEKCDLSYESRISRERVGGEIIILHFPLNTKGDRVKEALMRLPHSEIEAIYRLNNA